MHLRDRLIRLKDEGRLVVLYFGPHQDSFLARLLRQPHVTRFIRRAVKTSYRSTADS